MKQQQTTQPYEDLEQRAERLYPDNLYLREEWIRAVSVVRSTTGGWQLDRNYADPEPRGTR